MTICMCLVKISAQQVEEPNEKVYDNTDVVFLQDTKWIEQGLFSLFERLPYS